MNKIILYGLGKRGKGIYEYLKCIGCEDIIYGFCDRRAKEIEEIWMGKKVYLPKEIEEDVKYCITLIDNDKRKEIQNIIGKENCIEFGELADLLNIDRVKFNRDFCAFYHIDNMNSYFEQAENEQEIGMFWNFDTKFYDMFQKLDLSKVIELACGHGRHVTHYLDRASEITLVDILQENIDFCRERLGENKKIKFYKNNGYDLEELNSDEYSALFTYDAMVHFEMMDIYQYLKDIYRVLKKGGKALFHHSNNTDDYKGSFFSSVHGRSFMNKEIFAYLAYRVGFIVLEQSVIDWAGVKGLDCLTLLEK